jgi:hypothetical protein
MSKFLPTVRFFEFLVFPPRRFSPTCRHGRQSEQLNYPPYNSHGWFKTVVLDKVLVCKHHMGSVVFQQ